MAVVLAYVTSGLGHLYPMVPLLTELRDRGHDVHLRTMSSQVDLMRSQGFSVEAMDPMISRVVLPDWEARSARQALELTVEVFVKRAVYDGPDLQRAIDAVDPDVLIVDSASWGACFTAERWGGPWVRYSPFIPPISSRGTPAFGLGMVPVSGGLGRIRDRALSSIVMNELERAFAPRLNPLRTELGLPSIYTADDLFLTAPLLMYASAEPFEFHHPDWARKVMMVGPMTWDPPIRRPAWLDEIEGPLALVTTSSEYQGDESLPTVAFEALADQPFTVVATMPAGIDRRITPPPNGVLAEFVPHGPILDRSVVCVTHGGIGSTQKALVRGVPVCAVPYSRDQPEVAARLVHAGAGTRVKSRRLTPQSLRRGVLAAMDLADGAHRLSAALSRTPGPPGGALAVERILSGRDPWSP